jgi:hypothetical protein
VVHCGMYARRVHNAIQLDNIGMPAVDRDQREQREHFCGGTEGRNVGRRHIAIPIKATENWQNKLNARTHTSSALLPWYKATVIPELLPSSLAEYTRRTHLRSRRRSTIAASIPSRISCCKSMSPNGIKRKSTITIV